MCYTALTTCCFAFIVISSSQVLKGTHWAEVGSGNSNRCCPSRSSLRTLLSVQADHGPGASEKATASLSQPPPGWSSPQIFIGASSSSKFGCPMKISLAVRQSCRISCSVSCTCLPGLPLRTSSSLSMISSRMASSCSSHGTVTPAPPYSGCRVSWQVTHHFELALGTSSSAHCCSGRIMPGSCAWGACAGKPND